MWTVAVEKRDKARWSRSKCLRYRGIRHLFTSPQNLRRGHPNICFDVGSLGVKIEMVRNRTQSCDLEPAEREIAREIWSPPSAQFAKHWHAIFCLQITMMRKNFDSNPNAIQEGWSWSTMSPRRAVTKIQDSKVRFLGGSSWKHPTKHCQTIRLSRL